MVLRRLLAAEKLNSLFENEAQRQYSRTLQFSDLTGQVACRVRPPLLCRL
jgi:hypothetical protein